MAGSKKKVTAEDDPETRKRNWNAEQAVRDAQFARRTRFDNSVPWSKDEPTVLKVNADGTALVDTKDLYRTVIHNGDFDENGIEVCVVYVEFSDIEMAMIHSRSWNNERSIGCGFKKDSWVEILSYNEVYIRENGGKLPEKAKPAKKRA